jgi:hypothetical protein
MNALCNCIIRDVKQVCGRMLTATTQKGCNYILLE